MLDAHPEIHMRGEGSNANPCNPKENEGERMREVRAFFNKPGKSRVRGYKLGTMFLNDPASPAIKRMWVRAARHNAITLSVAGVTRCDSLWPHKQASRPNLKVICLHRSNSWQQAMSAGHKAAMMKVAGFAHFMILFVRIMLLICVH